MEMKSPPPCPGTVTIRRNPHRKARPTPSSAIPIRKPISPTSLSCDIFSTEIPQNPNNVNDKITEDLSETLKVFLRIRPLAVQKHFRSIAEPKNAWPKNPRVKGNSRPKIRKSSEICVEVNKDFRSVTVSTPLPLQEMKRIKSEVHEGFSHVFASEVSQIDVYEEMMKPLVEDFLKGKSGMLAAMGPSGSGKTHTVFGCAREPGMVPLALRRIFSDDESTVTHKSRAFYLSMFEISSEKGKSERMTDLLHDGCDISMQQSVIKGLKEALVSDAQQADSLIAKGMLKRLTATTCSNSQSSRSQCIINIRCNSNQDDEVDGNASSSMLTIVDLAGAEREKKTGNQGARLLESNFINNTSMVFGQCLRSLLEHQQNRNKLPLQKHYKNSLLTRYLQDYLEGKKRMALILTVKPGVEDYLDTSFLLRQASPFTKIKFKTVDGTVNVACNKRLNQASPQVMKPKKMKFSNSALIDEENIERSLDLNMHKEASGKVIKGCLNQNNKEIHDTNINEIHFLSDGFVGLRIQEKLSLKEDHGMPNVEKDREYRIMQGFSKALWTVLKQYKEKLERVEMENCNLRDSLAIEQRKNLNLVNELTREKMRLVNLESRLCILQGNSENLTYASNKLEKTDPSQIEDLVPSSEDTQNTKVVKDSSMVDIYSNCSSSRDLIFHEDMCIVDMPLISHATIQSLYESPIPEDVVDILGHVENFEPESKCLSNGSLFAISLDYEETTKTTQHCEDLKDAKKETAQPESSATDPTIQSLYESPRQEEDVVNILGHVENVDAKKETAKPENSGTGPTFQACIALDREEIAENTQQFEGLKDAKQVPEEEVVDILGYVENLEPESKCVADGSSFVTSLDNEESTSATQHFEDLKDANQATGSTFEVCIALYCEESAKSTQHSEDVKGAKQEPEEDVVDILGYVENMEQESKCESNESSFAASLESNKSTQHSEDLKNAKQEAAQSEKRATGSIVQTCIALDCEESAEYTQHSEDLGDVKQVPEKDVVDILGYVENLEPESKCILNESSFATSLDYEESNKSIQHFEDLKDAKQVPALSEKSVTGPTVQTCIALDCEESSESTQHFEDLKDAKQVPALSEKSVTSPTVQTCIALDCEESSESTQHSEDLRVAKQKPDQLGKGATDNDLSLVEEWNAMRPQTALSSSEFSGRENTSYHVEQCNKVKIKLEPPVTGLPEEGLNAKNEVKFVPKVSNFQNTEKPKRRLQPASSVLLKDISLLNIDDENDKIKGGRRVGKRENMNEKTRTQGSLSLLNLLTRKLD